MILSVNDISMILSVIVFSLKLFKHCSKIKWESVYVSYVTYLHVNT